MNESETRPLSEAERRLLPSAPGLPIRWTAGIGPGIVAAVVTFLLGLLFWASAPRMLGLIALVVALATYGYVVRGTGRPGRGPTTWDDVLDGTARVARFDATDAIAVEESEDEGLSFYVALADGRVLFLSGQYLYGPVERGVFPARRFEVVRTAVTGTVLAVTALGRPLAPSFTRAPFTDAEYDRPGMPGDGDVLPDPLARYRAAE